MNNNNKKKQLSLATLHSQKIIKEMAYISTSFQAPFKKRISFSFFSSIKEDLFIDFKCFYFIFSAY